MYTQEHIWNQITHYMDLTSVDDMIHAQNCYIWNYPMVYHCICAFFYLDLLESYRNQITLKYRTELHVIQNFDGI